jgi:hypothetical protein
MNVPCIIRPQIKLDTINSSGEICGDFVARRHGFELGWRMKDSQMGL